MLLRLFYCSSYWIVAVVSCKFQNGFLNLLSQDIAVHFSDTQHMVAT